MANKLDPGEKLLAGLVLIVVGLVGLVYWFTDYGFAIGGRYYMFHGGSYSLLYLIISTIFIVETVLGIYIVYDTIKKDSKIQ